MPTVPAVPRILLFGHPGSGKSSLLGALLRAGETQGATLGAEVVDPSGRLKFISDHIYAGAPLENTRTELVTYTVQLRPLPGDARTPIEPHDAVLMDCDGIAAHALLKHPDPITERSVRGTVVSAVVQCDLIALVVNAGTDDDGLNAAFDEFLMFLERVHGRKSFEREVGGFPIFLVLSQCDTLAMPGDTRAQWEEEVQKVLQHALQRFAEFLDDQEPEELVPSAYLAFGSVDLKGYAVAVREPDFLGARASRPQSPAAETAAHPGEPFGVAELFRDVFIAAESHRDRVRRSRRQLGYTLWAMAVTLWLMVAGAVAVSVFQPVQADPGLAGRVEAFWAKDQPAPVRLAEKNIARNKRALASFQADPGFFALSDDLRTYVGGRLEEIDAYQSYRTKLQAAAIPSEARTLEELAHAESVLNGELALPAQYTWGETEAAQLRDKWLADIAPIRAAESAWQEWYRGLVNQALALTHTRAFDGEWRNRVAALDTAASRPPFNPADPMPGSESVAQPRGEAVAYRIASEFDRVYQAARDWEFARSRLANLRDLADALGLTADPLASRRVLDIPPPGPAVDSATLPGERLTSLKQAFPRPDRTSDNPLSIPEWELSNFPEPARAVLAARIRESFDNGVRHTRRLIAEKVPSDAPEHWLKAAESLDEPAIRDWGRVLHFLARLEDPHAGDPVAELATCLRTTAFTLDVKGFDLAIPLALRVPAVVPTGAVTLTITPRGGEAPTVKAFKLVGEGSQQGLNTSYRFTADQTSTLTYRPGDGLKLEVAVRSGDQRFTLVWDAGTTRTYQFDRLAREPKLAPATGSSEPATGVTLTPIPGSTVPRLPVLLPELKR